MCKDVKLSYKNVRNNFFSGGGGFICFYLFIKFHFASILFLLDLIITENLRHKLQWNSEQ